MTKIIWRNRENRANTHGEKSTGIDKKLPKSRKTEKLV